MQITEETFKFPFKNSDWKGTAVVGGLVSLVGMALFPLMYLLYGFSVRVMRQTMRGEAPSLPEWDDWGQIIKDTWWYCLVMIVYILPVSLIIFTIWMAMFMLFTLAPVMMLPGSGPVSPQAESAAAFMSAFLMIVMFGALMIGTLLIMPLYFFASVAHTRAVAHDSLSRAFEVRQVWALLREGFANFLIAFLLAYAVQFGISLIASMLAYSIILSCLYPVFLGLGLMYGALIMSALFGRAYREAQGRMAAAGVIA
jgi:hypothetical protein